LVLQPVAKLLKAVAAVFEPARDINWADGAAGFGDSVSLLGSGGE